LQVSRGAGGDGGDVDSILKPVRVDEEITVEAHETNFVGRNIFQSGEIRNAAGDVLARGTARFVIIAAKQ